MAFWNKYPFTDFHELNLSWFLNEFIKLKDEVKNFYINFSEAIAENVNNWLDNHPEATTTVQDGSITYEKLNISLINRLRFNSKYPLFGNGRNATAGGSLISNSIQWGVNGDGTARTLSTYYNRDAVLNANILVNDVAREYVIGKQYAIVDVTATTVTIDAVDDYPEIGMAVQLFDVITNDLTSGGYVGIISGIDGATLTVNGWYRMGDDTEMVTPSGMNYAVVNIITRLYGNLIQVQDKSSASEWYRESFGTSTELYSENENSKSVYGHVVYLRSAKAETTLAYYANNTSNDMASAAFSSNGNFRHSFVANGTGVFDRDGRLETPKTTISNNRAVPVIVVSNGMSVDSLAIPENSEVLFLNNTTSQVSIVSNNKPFKKRVDSNTLFIDALDCVRAVITGSSIYINDPNKNLRESDILPNVLTGNIIRVGSDFTLNSAFENVSTMKEFVILNTSGSDRTLSISSGYCFVNGTQATSVTAKARAIMHGVYNPAGPTFFISSSN